MKKIFLIYLLVLISVIKLVAQNPEFISSKDYNPNFAFGIKQGVNYSSVSFDPGVDQSTTLGYNGGLVYKFQNEKNFALLIELNYTQKGWKENLDTVSNSYKRRLNYLELPIITHIVMGKREKMKVYANLGTAFAYFLSDHYTLEVNNERFRKEYYEKEIENYFDYSVLVDLGVLLNTGLGQFNVGLRYQLTFTDLFEVTEETAYLKSQNSLLNFSVTYFFLDNKK